MPEFNGNRLANIGDPIYDKDGVNLRTLNNKNGVLSTTAVTSSNIYVNPKIQYYGINYNGNVNVSIPSAVGKDGLNFSIKDEGGYAGTYRIRVTPDSGYIDGNNYVDMKINYMSLHLVARGGNWWII
jgi:hypothetical protein